MITYKDLVSDTPNADMKIVSMCTIGTKVLIATSYQIYVLEDNTIVPLEFTYEA